MTYANRTCNKCGIRKPQPEMYHTETFVDTGRSKQGVSGATFLGATLFGSKKSYDSLTRWLFNTNQRNYKRKKMIWLCGDCGGFGNKMKKGGFWNFLLKLFVLIIFLNIGIAIAKAIGF
jgi:hypothetical protein